MIPSLITKFWGYRLYCILLEIYCKFILLISFIFPSMILLSPYI